MQKEIFKQYYEADPLLLDCIKHAAPVTPTLQQNVEVALLLPIKNMELRSLEFTAPSSLCNLSRSSKNCLLSRSRNAVENPYYGMLLKATGIEINGKSHCTI
ncbi:hypothetical protein NDA00_25845 [Funiculus sociatus GB2-M2]|uniref:NACHT C-terminal helical domain 2-containing protein n=1 Tax=Funiculus sociatus TaxID=450527 RepID=UPI003298D769